MAGEMTAGGFELTNEQRTKAKKALVKAKGRLTSGAKRACARMAKQARFKIHACFVNDAWKEGHPTIPVVVWQTSPGRYTVAHCLVDLACQGIRKAGILTDLGEAQLGQFLHGLEESTGPYSRCKPGLAAAIVHEGVTQRLGLGFKLPADVFQMLALLKNIDHEPFLDQVPMGVDGKLLLIKVHGDDSDSVLAHLRGQVDADLIEVFEED